VEKWKEKDKMFEWNKMIEFFSPIFQHSNIPVFQYSVSVFRNSIFPMFQV